MDAIRRAEINARMEEELKALNEAEAAERAAEEAEE
jgi:hypothetical protein